MATHDITTNSIGTGIRVENDEGESTKVFAGVSVQRTDAGGPAIIAWESNSAIEILGSVQDPDLTFSAVILGNADTETNNSLSVGADGSITGNTKLFSHDSSITNLGTMDGIFVFSMDNGGDSSIDNSGEITDETAIQRSTTSNETLVLTNSGTITGTSFAFYSYANIVAVDQIINTGTITGKVLLGGGDDSYDGTGGRVVKGNVDGGDGVDTLTGGDEIDRLKGGAGNDILLGGGANDRMTGSAGADTLTGGAGRDSFIFASPLDSFKKKGAYDLITDFSRKQGDEIELRDIDANGSKPGNGEFELIGKHAFNHEAGELRFQIKGHNTFLYGDINGDGRPDFTIKFDDVIHFKATDFEF